MTLYSSLHRGRQHFTDWLIGILFGSHFSRNRLGSVNEDKGITGHWHKGWVSREQRTWKLPLPMLLSPCFIGVSDKNNRIDSSIS